MIRLELKTSVDEKYVSVKSTATGCDVTTVQQHYKGPTSTCGICSLLSVLCCTTGILHFVSELNLRLLDCFFSSSLGLWDLSLRRDPIVNNLVDELRLGKFNPFVRVHVGPASSLRRSLSKWTVAHAHRQSVRRFPLA